MKKQKKSKEVDLFILYSFSKLIEKETRKCIVLHEYQQTVKQSYDEVPLTIYG